MIVYKVVREVFANNQKERVFCSSFVKHNMTHFYTLNKTTKPDKKGFPLFAYKYNNYGPTKLIVLKCKATVSKIKHMPKYVNIRSGDMQAVYNNFKSLSRAYEDNNKCGYTRKTCDFVLCSSITPLEIIENQFILR